MNTPQTTGGPLWEPLCSITLTNERLDSPWHLAHEYLVGPKVLKFTAVGDWELFGGIPCGPDGLPGLPLATDRMLAAKVTVGCLMAKLGGSNASIDEGGMAPFVIGSFAIVQVPDKFVGSLFVGINTERSPVGQLVKQVTLNVQVSESPFPST